ncbi:MAG: glycosyltransferase, partial [Synechococcaceae cyanobacterium RM1_1_27]|nr:glycosyltransferase [Synechococcaceae cyanobacterium RM1_1_27]
MSLDPMPYLSIVVPIYNEVDSLPRLLERLRQVLTHSGSTYEILCVDDGSR